MAARFNPAKRMILLPCIIVCAGCASVPQTCVRCSLSCDGEPVLKEHKSVIASIKPPLQKDSDKVYNVSSLCDGERCSVPGCFQRDSLYTLEIYDNDDHTVSKILFIKTNLQPDCGPEGISDPDGAVGNLGNKLLILLAFLFFHLPLP